MNWVEKSWEDDGCGGERSPHWRICNGGSRFDSLYPRSLGVRRGQQRGPISLGLTKMMCDLSHNLGCTVAPGLRR